MLIRQSDYQPAQAADLPHDQNYLYIDIETTGFSRDSTILYMIGCAYPEDRGLHLIQWFNDDGVSEAGILAAFKNFFKDRDRTIITFNGDAFDLPYLRRRYELEDIPCPDFDGPSLDLYRILKPFQKGLGLAKGRQKDWEAFMGIRRKDTIKAGHLIALYRQYLKGRDKELEDLLFLHNHEDLCHLWQLSPLLSFRQLTCGAFSFSGVSLSPGTCSAGEAGLTFSCLLKEAFPRSLKLMSSMGSCLISEYSLDLTLPVSTGVMKHFFTDYSHYYYLPSEDRAVHKSVGCYVDRDHRRPCTAASCYVKKDGVFLPVYRTDTVKDLTLYQPDYRSDLQYIEVDDLFSGKDGLVSSYLSDALTVMIAKADPPGL